LSELPAAPSVTDCSAASSKPPAVPWSTSPDRTSPPVSCSSVPSAAAGVETAVVVVAGTVVEVDVDVEGEPAPGTLVTQENDAIEIEAEALSIPEQLTVSVEGVEPGTQITAGQVPLPAGVNLISDPELLVVNVVTAPTAEELEVEGAGEVPEREPAVEEAEAEAAAPDSESE
jgi:hypothetical protein